MSARLIDHLSKSEMAKEAERLLDRAGWLPEPLRLAGFEPAADEPAVAAEDLPDFLKTDEDTGAIDPEGPPPHAIAAAERAAAGQCRLPRIRFPLRVHRKA